MQVQVILGFCCLEISGIVRNNESDDSGLITWLNRLLLAVLFQFCSLACGGKVIEFNAWASWVYV